MKTYTVRWEIDVDADSPEAAARQALEIQRDPESIATVFEVFGYDNWVLLPAVRIDLTPEADE